MQFMYAHIYIWRCLVCFVVCRLVNMGPTPGGTYGLYWGGVGSSNLHVSRRGREESLAWLRLGLGKAGGIRMGWWGCQEGRTHCFPLMLQNRKQFSKYVSRTYSRARWRYGLDRNGFSAKVRVFHFKCHLNSHRINLCCFENPVRLAPMLPHVKSMPLPNLGVARRAVSNLGCPQ